MNKNHMEEVAKMLGVEIGEKFDVLYNNGEMILASPFQIGKDTLHDNRGVESGLVLLRLLNGTYTIKKTILNEEEKEYFEGVLRPFKDKVDSIAKYRSFEDEEYICIYITTTEEVVLPRFARDTMYKGMRQKRRYTLKELGLFE